MMRSIGALILGAAALVAAMATLPAAWVAHNVASEDGYVSFTEPLAKDPSLRNTFADAIAKGVVAQSAIPAVFQPVVTTAIASATLASSQTPGFVKAWDQTQRQSHKIMLGDERDLPAWLNASNRVAVDLGPLSQFTVKQINRTLPVQIVAPKQLIVDVGGNSSSGALDQIKKTPSWAKGGLMATGILVALCLIVARRRGLAVGLLGVGVVGLAAGLHGLSTAVLTNLQDNNTATSPLAKPMLDVLAGRAGDSFDQWLTTLAAGGAIAVVAGLVVTFGFSFRAKA